ncbi:S8 family serine peptidase [Actinoplanes oblitus]|uniref:S8 family serine peptidase n=1 Tax=Actinoplanes oblitus TaxID=3040509 RepID=A0ABY8WC38_9ACTN|nr:S8 family serine peptidase [Actinoplanes oblitus]WIM94922.1 S8 family serine peptidase [Actinoplanes oblitus]
MPESEGRRGSTARSHPTAASTALPEIQEIPVGPRPTAQYLLAPRSRANARQLGVQPLSAGMLNAAVQGLDVVRRIQRPHATLATLGVGHGDATDILVANMEPDHAQLIAATAPQLVIGANSALTYGGGPALMQDASMFGMFPAAAVKPKEIRFKVLGENDRPLEGAVVTLTGDTVPSQGTTNSKGEVNLDLYTLHDRPARSLFVMRPGGYWDLYLTEPAVSDAAVNVVRLRGYAETISGFPRGYQHGWGQRLMGLDRLNPNLRGEGVKVAIIDSGADNTHPLLSHLKIGRDFTNGNTTAWSNDLVGHGSHCAGVIGARSEDLLRGFVPDAEIHVLKVFPGGRYDSLIDALDYCIDHNIDVVNMSLGGDTEINAVVEETLTAAVNAGVACIVAAGNSGDAVKYPARSSYSFAVSAVGSIGEVQPNTWDRSNLRPQFLAADGIFSPAFTCYGPEVAVCAPGVAIISTVPGGNFESQSGTSMAAPHVTGLAALLLAHHPVFRQTFAARGPARVAGLFSMIRSLCAPYGFGPTRVGAGMPTLATVASQLVPAGQPDSATAGHQPTPSGAQGFAPGQIPTPAPAMAGMMAPQAAGPMAGMMAPQAAGPIAGGFLPFAAVPGLVPVPVAPTGWVYAQQQTPPINWLLAQAGIHY